VNAPTRVQEQREARADELARYLKTSEGIAEFERWCGDTVPIIQRLHHVGEMEATWIDIEYVWRHKPRALAPLFPSALYGPQTCGGCGGSLDSLLELQAHEAFCSF
jgi:hypothetical protein